VEVKEISENLLGIVRLLFQREAKEFLAYLMMVERKDDISKIEENDFYRRIMHKKLFKNIFFTPGTGGTEENLFFSDRERPIGEKTSSFVANVWV
jgi:hypothetical protein